MTAYFWREGVVIEVQRNGQDEPVLFTWKGQAHEVDMLIRHWRVDVAWWQNRVWRAYFKLSTQTGLLVIIYQDLGTGAWFLQQLYD
jgi:hypothetical protein